MSHEWVELLYVHVGLAGLSPPAAARVFAYTAVADALLRGAAPERLGLSDAPASLRTSAGVHGDVEVAVAAAYEAAATHLFRAKGYEAFARPARRLFLRQKRDRAQVAPAAQVERSEHEGRRFGVAVALWASTDGSAAQRPPFVPAGPASAGFWEPTPPESLPASDPWAGLLRPVLVQPDVELSAGPPLPFSTAHRSRFRTEALDVADASRTASPADLDAALFWADPTRFSGTPAGHWMRIATAVERQSGTRGAEAAARRALLAATMLDAFIACWRDKYRYQVLRPITYINQQGIDRDWTPLMPTPAFPEYPSGHAVVSHAAAAVLAAAYGDRPFQDESLSGLGLPSRPYRSFTAAAMEAANSRRVAGLHYRSSCERGAALGRRVAARALQSAGP